MAQNGNNQIPGSAKLDPQPKNVKIGGVGRGAGVDRELSNDSDNGLDDDFISGVTIKNAAGGPYGSGR